MIKTITAEQIGIKVIRYKMGNNNSKEDLVRQRLQIKVGKITFYTRVVEGGV